MAYRLNRDTVFIALSVFLFLFIGGYFVVTKLVQDKKPDFAYTVDVGSADGYSVILDFNNNYLTDNKDKVLLPFTCPEGVAGSSWGSGGQATGLFNGSMPLPHGIRVRWFSVAENQFWEGYHLFDQKRLKYVEKRLSQLPDFIIDYAPGGLVTIWGRGDGELFLVDQFKAHKASESDWDSFIQPFYETKAPNYKQYLDYQYNGIRHKTPYATLTPEIQKEVKENRVPGAEHWQRLMKTYQWHLSLKGNYELKGYRAAYINGEEYYAFPKTDGVKPRPAPLWFEVYFTMPDNPKLNELDFDFNRDDMYQKFQEISKEGDSKQPITLQFDINENITNVDVDLIKGEHKIRVDKVEIDLTDIAPQFTLPKHKTLD